MNPTRLVQRLSPSSKPVLGPNPFTFGCVRNGGFSDDAMQRLMHLCDFDYMGAAEYEFGSCPKALSALVAGDPVAFHLKIKKTPVYVICRAAHRADMYQRLTDIALNKMKTRDGTYFDWVVRPPKWLRESVEAGRTTMPKVCGWLELDNGFMWFTNPDMFKGFAKEVGATLDESIKARYDSPSDERSVTP
jgi:hypothetical protein